MKILVTGTAGFIGFHLKKQFKNAKVDIVIQDSNETDYLKRYNG